VWGDGLFVIGFLRGLSDCLREPYQRAPVSVSGLDEPNVYLGRAGDSVFFWNSYDLDTEIRKLYSFCAPHLLAALEAF
jgi:hypothetical protein